WYYTLKEAELVEHGRQLGPVGGRIVGEVIIGLLDLDRHSFLSVNRRWRPTLPTTSGQVTGEVQMIDFLTFAGGGPASRKKKKRVGRVDAHRAPEVLQPCSETSALGGTRPVPPRLLSPGGS